VATPNAIAKTTRRTRTRQLKTPLRTMKSWRLRPLASARLKKLCLLQEVVAKKTQRMIPSLARKRKEKVERRGSKLSRKTIGDKSKAREAKRAKQQVLTKKRLPQPPITLTTRPKRKRKRRMLQLAILSR